MPSVNGKNKRIIAPPCKNLSTADYCVIHHTGGDFTNPDQLENGYLFYCESKITQCFDSFQTAGLTRNQKLYYLKQAIGWMDKLIANVEN